MSVLPDCPYCSSHEVRELNAAISGISGFRCQACAKIFYVASADVLRRIQEAQTKHAPTDGDEPRVLLGQNGSH